MIVCLLVVGGALESTQPQFFTNHPFFGNVLSELTGLFVGSMIALVFIDRTTNQAGARRWRLVQETMVTTLRDDAFYMVLELCNGYVASPWGLDWRHAFTSPQNVRQTSHPPSLFRRLLNWLLPESIRARREELELLASLWRPNAAGVVAIRQAGTLLNTWWKALTEGLSLVQDAHSEVELGLPLPQALLKHVEDLHRHVGRYPDDGFQGTSKRLRLLTENLLPRLVELADDEHLFIYFMGFESAGRRWLDALERSREWVKSARAKGPIGHMVVAQLSQYRHALQKAQFRGERGHAVDRDRLWWAAQEASEREDAERKFDFSRMADAIEAYSW